MAGIHCYRGSPGAVMCTHHHPSLQEQVMHSLCDISSVHQVVVGVFMFAVSNFQGLHKRHHCRDGDLAADRKP